MNVLDFSAFSEPEARSYKIIKLLYHAYEGYKSCTQQLREAVRNNDEEGIRILTGMQNEYRKAALKACRMLE